MDEVLKPIIDYGCPEVASVRDPMNNSIREEAGFDVISTALRRLSGVIPTVRPNNMIMKIKNTANQQESNT